MFFRSWEQPQCFFFVCVLRNQNEPRTVWNTTLFDKNVSRDQVKNVSSLKVVVSTEQIPWSVKSGPTWLSRSKSRRTAQMSVRHCWMVKVQVPAVLKAAENDANYPINLDFFS